MNLRIAYNIDKKHLHIGVAAYWRKLQRGPGSWQLWLSLVVLLMVFTLWSNRDATWRGTVILVCIFSILWIYDRLCFWLLLRQKSAQIAARVTKDSHFIITDAGMTFDAGSEQASRSWSSVQDIVINDYIILLIWGKYDFTVLPRNSATEELILFFDQSRKPEGKAESKGSG